MSTSTCQPNAALYYPFHLCHALTLETLLRRFQTIHFRDYMALRLTVLSGTTAYQDRMGDQFPDLVASGRIVQGYSVSGTPPPAIAARIDRDLADEDWRRRFHEALCDDRRFQRGLFDPTHAMSIGRRLIPGPAALLELMNQRHRQRPYTLRTVGRLSLCQDALAEGYAYEYGLALVKTSAALAYTLQLSTAQRLAVVTDSRVHFDLLERSCVGRTTVIANHLVERDGY